MQLYLVSGGFRQLIEPIAQHLDIPRESIFANLLLFDQEGNQWQHMQMHTDHVEGSLSVVCWMCVCVWCCDVVPALMQGSIMVLMSPSRPAAPVARRVWWGMSRDSTRGELWASGAGWQHQPLTSLYALHLHSDDIYTLATPQSGDDWRWSHGHGSCTTSSRSPLQ